MKFWRSGWFYIIALLILVIIAGSIWHKCSIDSLKDNNNQLLQQLLEDSNYQTKKLDDTIYGIKTIQNSQLSEDLLTKKLKETLDKYDLSQVYGAQIQLQASITKILEGQAGATTIIPRPTTTTTTQPSTTTIIVREPSNNDSVNDNSGSNNSPIHSNDPPSTESVNVCNQCLASNIIRVPFDAQEGFLRVSGWTDSGTALGETGSYHLDVSWIKDIELSIALAQSEDGTWETLIDSNDENVEISRIRSEISTVPWEGHWYNKLFLNGGVAFGANGVLTSLGLGYGIGNFAVSAEFYYDLAFDGTLESYNDHAFYGINLSWHP